LITAIKGKSLLFATIVCQSDFILSISIKSRSCGENNSGDEVYVTSGEKCTLDSGIEMLAMPFLG
jgi:hypothetical protein